MDTTPASPATEPTVASPLNRRRTASRLKPDDIFQILAEDIVEGRLVPGEKLDERDLAEKFAVSRTPVREALAQLSASGLAVKEPNRGVFVRKMPLDQLAQLFEAMAEIEASCARMSAERMTPAERRELEELHLKSGDNVRAGDLPGYEAHNRTFHGLIYLGTHNPVIIDIVQDIRRRATPFRRAQFHVMGRLASSYEEHGQIVEAICRGDGITAHGAMINHLRIVSGASAEYLTGLSYIQEGERG